MVRFWRFRKKAKDRFALGEERANVVFTASKKRGNLSQYEQQYLNYLTQRFTAKYLVKHGATKEMVDRATNMKWNAKQMLADMEIKAVGRTADFKLVRMPATYYPPKSQKLARMAENKEKAAPTAKNNEKKINPLRYIPPYRAKKIFSLSKRDLTASKEWVKQYFEESVKPKLERDLGEMYQPRSLKNMKKRLRENQSK